MLLGTCLGVPQSAQKNSPLGTFQPWALGTPANGGRDFNVTTQGRPSNQRAKLLGFSELLNLSVELSDSFALKALSLLVEHATSHAQRNKRPKSDDCEINTMSLTLTVQRAPNPSKFAPTCARRPKRPKQTCTNSRPQALIYKLRTGTHLHKFAPPRGRHSSGGPTRGGGVQIRVGLEPAEQCSPCSWDRRSHPPSFTGMVTEGK